MSRTRTRNTLLGKASAGSGYTAGVRVLLTRLSAFGDIVHTWPLAAALAAASEPATIAWLVEEPLLPLVAAHPAVARAIPVATRRWRRRPLSRRTWDEIRAARDAIREFAPEVALDPQGLAKSALWAWLSGVPRRVGLAPAERRERLAGAFYTEVAAPSAARHVVDLNLALLAPLGVRAQAGVCPDGRFLLAADATPAAADARSVALLPGAGRPGKCWPAEHFAALARRLACAGWQPLVVVGPGEEELGRRVVAAAAGAAALAPPTTLPQLAAVLAACRAAVGGDTGPVHLAAALGTPTVAVFLSSDPERNGPRGSRVHIVTAACGGASRGRARTAPAGEVGVDAVAVALERALHRGVARDGRER